MRQIPLWGPEAPPKLQRLTRELRHLNAMLSGPIAVGLTGKGRILATIDKAGPVYGSELVPGRGQKFDAVASARRLLAALRDLEPTAL
jgi:hypothetical protein